MEDTDRAPVAAAVARAGGNVALESFRGTLDVGTKAHKNDLVTAADGAAQERILERLAGRAPGEPVVAEEGERPTELPGSGPAWVVDPIDGTANYARGARFWTTSVGATVDGEPVGAATVLPALGDAYVAGAGPTRLNGEAIRVSDRQDPETFAVGVLGWGPHGERGAYAALARTVIDRFGDMRRLGSMQGVLALVASGGLEGAITTGRPNAWDSVAGTHLVERAGGTVTDLEGESWRHGRRGLVASNGETHGALLSAARAAADGR